MGLQETIEKKSMSGFPVGQWMTADEFEKLPVGPPYPELINNILVMPPSPEFIHQDISISLSSKLHLYVRDNKLGLVLNAPMDVRFDDDNVFQPDILFISNERLGIIEDGRKIKGAPDLIVEILSSNKKSDLEEKKYIYELYDVREYWLVDPKKKTVEVFENQRKEFVLLQKAYLGDTVRSKLLEGFEIAADYLFREIPKP